MTMPPAKIEHMVKVAELSAGSARGKKGDVIAQTAKTLGQSRSTVYRDLAKVAVRKPRKQRSDAGAVALTRPEAEILSAYILPHYRGTGKRGITLGTALRDLRQNGKIRCEVVHAVTGELRQLSESAVERALKVYGLHWEQMRVADRPMAVAQSTPHPNHTWQIDASVCTLFYLDDDGTSPMPDHVFYKNRPENFERVEKQRVTRFVITDHTSGVIKVRYFLGGESVANYSEFFLWAIQKQPGYSDPFHGVPMQLMADPGSGLAGAFKNLVRRLMIKMIINAPGNPRAKGQVENAQNLVEMGFEHQFRAHRPANLAELNARAQVWACNYNATAVHSRHGKTRFMKWMEIGAQELRIAPPLALCRELLTADTKDCVVDNFGRVQFGGGARRWDTRSVPGVATGQKLAITYNAYNDQEVYAVYLDGNGMEVLHPCPLVQIGEHGFAADARQIGEGYKTMADTATDTARKQALLLAAGTPTLAEAKKAMKKKDFEVFNGTVRFDYLARENEAQAPFVPKPAVPLEVQTATTSTPQPVRVLTIFEVAAWLAANGVLMTREKSAQVRSWHPDGVPEDELKALAAKLSVRASLRVIPGGAS